LDLRGNFEPSWNFDVWKNEVLVDRVFQEVLTSGEGKHSFVLARGNESWFKEGKISTWSWGDVNIAGVEFVAANLGNMSEHTLTYRKAKPLTLQPENNLWGWKEKSIGGRQARRIGNLIVKDTRYVFTPITSSSSSRSDTRLIAIPSDTGLECVMINWIHWTHEKINMFTVGREI
jgi:hypothetical protein